jgi:hypothetical protein
MRLRLPMAGLVCALALVWSTQAIGAPESHAPRDTPTRPAEPRPLPRDATPTAHDAPRKAPIQGYISRGVRSRFCIGAGLHLGVNSLTTASPLISGLGIHFRASGVVGLTLEYDFKRVAKTPAPGDVSVEALHFIPNLRIAAVIYPYRWRMLGPFVMIGLGIDTVSNEDRANFQVGLGLEVTVWHDRFAFVAEFRAFIPRPTDVEVHKERLEITGESNIPSTRSYYNVDNLLFTLSARFYY